MKNLLKIISIVLITTIFSCSKDNDSPPPVIPKVETVYVGGIADDANGFRSPTIWTNGVAQSLPIVAGNNGWVNAVFVEGNDVYAIGYEATNFGYKAIMWKNNIKTTLSQSTQSEAKSIFVSDGKYYVVGTVAGVATLWYNNTEVAIDTFGTKATSIHIKNNKIYIVGNEVFNTTSTKAVLWKNEVSLTYPIAFTKTLIENNANVRDVFYDGTNLHSVGSAYLTLNTAKLWKNNLPSEQYGDDSLMFSVFVNEQNVYAAGITNRPNKATLWKNNAQTVLSQNNSTAEAVFATSSNVYVVGYETATTEKACIWRNGEIKILSDNFSRAYSVFVTEK